MFNLPQGELITPCSGVKISHRADSLRLKVYLVKASLMLNQTLDICFLRYESLKII